MGKYAVFSHSNLYPEAEMTFICECESNEMAERIKAAMEMFDVNGVKVPSDYKYPYGYYIYET